MTKSLFINQFLKVLKRKLKEKLPEKATSGTYIVLCLEITCNLIKHIIIETLDSVEGE